MGVGLGSELLKFAAEGLRQGDAECLQPARRRRQDPQIPVRHHGFDGHRPDEGRQYGARGVEFAIGPVHEPGEAGAVALVRQPVRQILQPQGEDLVIRTRLGAANRQHADSLAACQTERRAGPEPGMRSLKIDFRVRLAIGDPHGSAPVDHVAGARRRDGLADQTAAAAPFTFAVDKDNGGLGAAEQGFSYSGGPLEGRHHRAHPERRIRFAILHDFRTPRTRTPEAHTEASGVKGRYCRSAT